MTSSALRLLVVADFNTANLETLLGKSVAPALDPVGLPLGNVYQSLLAPPEAGAAFVWTRPEAVIPSFRAILANEPTARDSIIDEVDGFADLIIGARSRVNALLVSNWVLPWYRRGLGILDLKAPDGVGRTLLAMNTRLTERLADERDVFLLSAQRWAQSAGARGDSPAGWYLGKMPYSTEILKIAVADVTAALRALRGEGRKLIVVDLDDTLWGGTVGDTGWEGLVLGGHHPIGEAHQDFQRALKALARRGIVLAIASKNEESVALEAIRKHPEMILHDSDFAAWRINWDDKASSITSIAEQLNLGLQHVVFLDDNPYERGRVRESLPDVMVPDWPADPRQYVTALETLDCFDTSAITEEDHVRGAMYVVERDRQEFRRHVATVAEWLAALELRLTVEPLRPASLARATQLLNKTNQMNLTGRRLTESELAAWASLPGHTLWTVSVTDRFGDAGLTGLIGIRVTGSCTIIEHFVLSCRVFGRQIEEVMLHVAATHSARAESKSLEAVLVPTIKNKPTLEFFLERSGMSRDGEYIFRSGDLQLHQLPAHVTLLGSWDESP